MDKLKQAGSLMKQMNGLKKKIDKLETFSVSKDGNIEVVVQGTSNIKSIKIDDEALSNYSSKDLEKNLSLITKAFQRRFRQDLISGIIDKECLIISHNLVKNLN